MMSVILQHHELQKMPVGWSLKNGGCLCLVLNDTGKAGRHKAMVSCLSCLVNVVMACMLMSQLMKLTVQRWYLMTKVKHVQTDQGWQQ